MNLLKSGRPINHQNIQHSSLRDLVEETARMNMNVPKSFYKAVKKFALEQDITVTELVIKSLNEYMENSTHRRDKEWIRR
jgi:hypothetical protein